LDLPRTTAAGRLVDSFADRGQRASPLHNGQRPGARRAGVPRRHPFIDGRPAPSWSHRARAVDPRGTLPRERAAFDGSP